MASEYLKWKYRDIKPDEPVTLSQKEKRKNWWHYHKWHIAVSCVLLFVFVDIGWHAMGLGEVKPDYQFAYVGTDILPNDIVSALESALASLGEDANGDGKVIVKLNQYPINYEKVGTDDAAAYSVAAEIKLIADIEECESFFFILENPETFQANYQALAMPDGNLPTDGENGLACAIRWSDCTALKGLALGEYTDTVLDQTVIGNSQALLSKLYVARRGFWTEQRVKFPEESERLWKKILEGAFW